MAFNADDDGDVSDLTTPRILETSSTCSPADTEELFAQRVVANTLKRVAERLRESAETDFVDVDNETDSTITSMSCLSDTNFTTRKMLYESVSKSSECVASPQFKREEEIDEATRCKHLRETYIISEGDNLTKASNIKRVMLTTKNKFGKTDGKMMDDYIVRPMSGQLCNKRLLARVLEPNHDSSLGCGETNDFQEDDFLSALDGCVGISQDDMSLLHKDIKIERTSTPEEEHTGSINGGDTTAPSICLSPIFQKNNPRVLSGDNTHPHITCLYKLEPQFYQTHAHDYSISPVPHDNANGDSDLEAFVITETEEQLIKSQVSLRFFYEKDEPFNIIF